MATNQAQQDLINRSRSVGNFLTAPFRNIPNAIKDVGAGFNALRTSRGNELRQSQNLVVSPTQSQISYGKLTNTSPYTTLGPQRPPSSSYPTAGTPSATSPTSPARSAFVDRVASTTPPPAQTSGGFQSTLAANDPAAIGGALMLNKVASSQTNAPPQQTLPPGPAPMKQDLPGADAAYKDAYTQYIQSLAPGKDSQAAKQKYLDFIQQRDLGLQEISDKPIPLRFVTGQQESLQKLSGIEANRLQGDVQLAQEQQQATQAQDLARLNYEKSLLDQQTAANKPIEVGGRLVNPQTGQVVYEPPSTAESKSYTLSPGQKVYDSSGNIIASNDSASDKLTTVPAGSTVIDSQGNVVYQGSGAGSGTSGYSQQIAQRTVGQIDDALKNVSATTTGLIGSTSSKIPGTKAYDFARQLDTIKANIGFNELQAMRDASKTGGALGQVSERELAFLTSVLGSLDIGQKPETLKANLEAVRESLNRWNKAVEQNGSTDQYELNGVIYENDGSGNYVPKAKGGSSQTGAALKSLSIGGKSVTVDASIADRLTAANADFKRATGQDIQVNQSYRTHEQQAQLYKELSPKGARVAPPGKSFHEKGLAIDVANWKAAEPYLRKYGLLNNLADDKGHFSYGEFA